MEVVFYIIFWVVIIYFIRNYGDDKKKEIEENSSHNRNIPSYDQSIICIIACMMKADGKVTKRELSAVKNYLLKTCEDERDVKEKLLMLRELLPKLDKKTAQDIRLFCIRINQMMNYKERLAFLSMLFQIAVADGMISDEEAKLVQQYARFTCIRRIDFVSMQRYYTYGYKWKEDKDRRSKYKQRQYEQEEEQENQNQQSSNQNQQRYNQNQQNSNQNQQRSQSSSQNNNLSADEAWAYKTLGLSPNASEKEIKKAYRTLVQQYHPDKQIGASDEKIKYVTERIVDINRAYEILMEKK